MVKYQGTLQTWLCTACFRTDIGSVQTDLKLSSDKAKALFSYSGGVKTTDFELGQLLGNKQLGKITFNLDVRETTTRANILPLR